MPETQTAIGGLMMLSGILIGVSLAKALTTPTCDCKKAKDEDNTEVVYSVPRFEAGADPGFVPNVRFGG